MTFNIKSFLQSLKFLHFYSDSRDLSKSESWDFLAKKFSFNRRREEEEEEVSIEIGRVDGSVTRFGKFLKFDNIS